MVLLRYRMLDAISHIRGSESLDISFFEAKFPSLSHTRGSESMSGLSFLMTMSLSRTRGSESDLQTRACVEIGYFPRMREWTYGRVLGSSVFVYFLLGVALGLPWRITWWNTVSKESGLFFCHVVFLPKPTAYGILGFVPIAFITFIKCVFLSRFTIDISIICGII